MSQSIDGKRGATSILELLTEANPPVKLHHYQQPKGQTRVNTTSNQYMSPRQLTEWKDFSMNNLNRLYNGNLMAAAREERSSLPDYPYLSPGVDCVVRCERTSVHVLTKWNHSIVQPAVDALGHEFNTCDWTAFSGNQRRTQRARTQPACGHTTPEPLTPSPARVADLKKAKDRNLIPDGGTALRCRSHGHDCPSSSFERLPKEYKTASKWTSSAMLQDANVIEPDTGMVLNDQDDKISPMKQAFTYCVRRNCRYGCILTTHEAFIFRIRPRVKSDQELDTCMSIDGLVEYVSIPWEASGRSVLTYNLALWVLHVLAGNDSEVEFDYPDLHQERLVNEKCKENPITMTPDSPQRIPLSKKRSNSNHIVAPSKRRKSATEDAVDSPLARSVAPRKKNAARVKPPKQLSFSASVGSLGMSEMNIMGWDQSFEQRNV